MNLRFCCGLTLALSLLAGAGLAAATDKPIYTFKAEMDTAFGSTPGTLFVYPNKLFFEALDREQSREWPYAELRYLEWKGPGKVELKTRERDARWLGKKKTYTFLIPDASFNEQHAQWVNDRIHQGFSTGPAAAPGATTPAAQPAAASIMWPVVRKAEHTHSFGGCHGSLVLGPDSITYRPVDSDHEVRLSYMDIQKVDRKSPFNLRLTTYKKSAKKMWMSQDIEFNLLSEGLGDDVFQYIQAKVSENQAEAE
jgi:hypothetical protein